MQSRPFYPAGPNDRHHYGNNFCFLHRKHWKFQWASDAAEKALDTAGYRAAERKIIPGAFLLLPESQDVEVAEISRAMMETYACGIQPHLPAYAAGLKSWLAALHYGDYKPADQAMRLAAENVEPEPVRSVMVQGADVPEQPTPEQIRDAGDDPVDMETKLAAAGARALDTRPAHLRDGTDAPPAPPPKARPAKPGRKVRARSADRVHPPSEGERL